MRYEPVWIGGWWRLVNILGRTLPGRYRTHAEAARAAEAVNGGKA